MRISGEAQLGGPPMPQQETYLPRPQWINSCVAIRGHTLAPHPQRLPAPVLDETIQPPPGAMDGAGRVKMLGSQGANSDEHADARYEESASAIHGTRRRLGCLA